MLMNNKYGKIICSIVILLILPICQSIPDMEDYEKSLKKDWDPWPNYDYPLHKKLNSHIREPPIVIPATSKHTATLLFLHGLGDYGERLEEKLQKCHEPYLKIIMPTANEIRVDVQDKLGMHAWYNMLDKNHTVEDLDGIENATDYVHKIIEAEIEGGTPANKILLGGFSQGGTLALHAALTFPKKLAGVIAYSTWFPKNDTFAKHINPTNKDIPVLKCKVGEPDEWDPFKEFHKFKYKSYDDVDYALTDDEFNEMKYFIIKHTA